MPLPILNSMSGSTSVLFCGEFGGWWVFSVVLFNNYSSVLSSLEILVQKNILYN